MATGSVQHPGRDVRQGGFEDQRWRYSRNGLPPVPGRRNTGGSGVRATDYGCAVFVLGDTACTGTLHGVQGGDGARVAGSPSTDSARKINRR